jgi:signal transduction histidine kinase
MKSSRRFIIVTFALVGVGAIATTLFAVAQTRLLSSNVHTLVDDMLTSIRLLGQLDDEVARRHNLVNAHISADAASDIAKADSKIASSDGQIADNLRDYERWIDVPGERAAWNRTLADVTALEGALAHALAFSRKNQDEEARRVMEHAAPLDAAVGADFDQLIALNHRAAKESLEGFATIRERLVLTLLGIGLAAVAGILALGRWALMQITRREEQMVMNADRLEVRNRELDAFAGRVAHDIRGGLAAVDLALTSLSARVPADDRVMKILRRGTWRMEALVEDLLTLARVESFVRGTCDPSSVVTQVAQDLAPRIEAEKGTLKVSVAPAEVACSEGLLRQAIMNLVENAVKYHRPGIAPEIEVSGTTAAGRYALRVSDNGIGMSEDEAVRVAEPFYRSPRAAELPGTGLGLSIVSRVAEASRGTLSVDTALGRGSSFVVHLPLSDGRELGAPT